MSFLIFYIGCCLGSFCDVVSHRLIKKEAWVLSRSYCDFCLKKLKIIHIFPIFSYFALNGKCPYCQKKVPIQHLYIEMISGVGFYLLYVYLNNWLFVTIIMMLLLIISLMDVKNMYFDGELLFILFVTSVSNALYLDYSFIESFLGAISISLPLSLFRKYIGEGDLWIIAIIGISLKLQGIILAFYIAVYLSTFFSLFLLLLHKKSITDPIPFCPFLSIGIFFAFMLGS